MRWKTPERGQVRTSWYFSWKIKHREGFAIWLERMYFDERYDDGWVAVNVGLPKDLYIARKLKGLDRK